jgi:thiamine-phosphate pyrophosphorylase
MLKSELFFRFRLHAVTDNKALESGDFYRRAESLCSTGGVAVNLRAHGLTGRELFEYARKLRSLTAEAAAPLIINDRLDVALAVQADAVHLGERSIPLEKAVPLCRERGLLCGFSCHRPEQAALAVEKSVDYVYLGTIFPSAGKPGVVPAGVESIEETARLVDCPVFAIGGIIPENADKAARTGAFGCAAITGLWHCPDPETSVRRYLAAFGE